MNRLLITVLLISSAAIFSQELDERYLESLPDNIREDVLLKNRSTWWGWNTCLQKAVLYDW